jgi:HK97 family phage portal protein
MGIFDRMRSAWGVLSGESSGYITVTSGGNWGQSTALTDDRFMRIAAYFACIRNISEDVAKLPLITYRRLARGKSRAPEHPLSSVLGKSPHPAIGSMAFRETLTRYALGWGNGYAQILRSGTSVPTALEPIHPGLVDITTSNDGRVKYIVRNGGENKTIPAADMLHIHGLSSNGVCGLSVAGLSRETMEFAGSAQTYGRNLFARGGRPCGTLTVPGKLTPDAQKMLRESWDEAHGGENSGRTAVLPEGIKYETISINPVDAQYLETRQFTVEEIARWFRMPLHKIQYLVRAQGWSTLDAQNTDYLTDTLMPWLVRWEQEIARKLFADDPEYFAEHLVNGMLRGDQKSRSEYYVKQFSIGALSINEIRELENMNPIDGDGGDKHFVPLNMTPAEFANSVSGSRDKDGNNGNA